MCNQWSAPTPHQGVTATHNLSLPSSSSEHSGSSLCSSIISLFALPSSAEMTHQDLSIDNVIGPIGGGPFLSTCYLYLPKLITRQPTTNPQ
ncbi:hypothetical protein AVEN_67176-1 [Araneus ventricosus]|uniref:Uncharacterized protein n=1 Tax=Araneus ventricosus TaxID=182803 RepID=A0A4Y2PS14_ARAVE|nr:hypothetical protein AVEN_67176-1 [Araneus ventricosus]